MTNEEAAWLAGIVDGEGSIVVAYRGSSRIGMSLSVANTDQALIDKCHQIAECGSISDAAPRDATRKKQWQWQVHCHQAKGIINRILPYMVETDKRRRAALALEFPCGERRKYVTEDMKRHRQQLRKAIMGRP